MGGSPTVDRSTRCVSEGEALHHHDALTEKISTLPTTPLTPASPRNMEVEEVVDKSSVAESREESDDAMMMANGPLDSDDDDEGTATRIRNSSPADNVNQPTNRRGQKISVSFSKIQIRRYNIVVGDHPCCTMGCPLSLGWDYKNEDEEKVLIDHFEATRGARRSRAQLRTTCEERLQLLADDGGYSEQELRKELRKLHRARSQLQRNEGKQLRRPKKRTVTLNKTRRPPVKNGP